MLDQKDCHIKLPADKCDGVHQLFCLVRIHAGCGLIKQKELGACCHGSCDLELTLLTVREIGCEVITLKVQSKDL